MKVNEFFQALQNSKSFKTSVKIKQKNTINASLFSVPTKFEPEIKLDRMAFFINYGICIRVPNKKNDLYGLIRPIFFRIEDPKRRNCLSLSKTETQFFILRV